MAGVRRLKMADTSAQADIRGINIQKVATGFADEALILRRFVGNSTTKAREIRWYKKTAGFLDSVDTTGITASQIANTSSKSLFPVVEQSWTRTTSYIRKYAVESPLLSIEDLKDNDIDILATNVRDLVRAVGNQIDIRIYTAITTDGSLGTGTATADGWDDQVTGDPILDILKAKNTIRLSRYNPEGGVLYIHPTEHKNLINYLISVKGSSIPNFSSEKVKSGVVMEILGLNVVVSLNATTDQALIFVKNIIGTWKSFMPLKTAILDDPGLGKKIRVWEEGEFIVQNPEAGYLITDTVV